MELPANRVLDAWESAHSSTVEARNQLMLGLVMPESSVDDLGDLTIGERNERLLMLRRSLFGSTLSAYVECPHCEEALDLEFSVDQFGFDAPLNLPAKHAIGDDSLSATVRLPNGHDFNALSQAYGVREGRALLFSRCVSDLRHEGKPADIQELEHEQLEMLDNWIADIDPRAELLFDLNCPNCENQWRSPLDIAAFLWREFDTYARELLENIHMLARAYGWSEAAILAMSEQRRRYYIDRVLQ